DHGRHRGRRAAHRHPRQPAVDPPRAGPRAGGRLPRLSLSTSAPRFRLVSAEGRGGRREPAAQRDPQPREKTMSTTVPQKLAVACRGVTKEFGQGDSRTLTLRGIDLDIHPGEITLLVGPSGCGKTTLISIIAGILDPTAGSVSVLGADLARLSAAQ